MAILARLGLAALVLASAACSFGNLDELDGEQCGEKLKVCTVEGRPQCVSATSATFGCANANCAPCSFPQGEARCGPSGKCELSACRVPFQDCNRDLTDGCEADTDTNPNACGPSCTKCELNNANPVCNGGVCAISSCKLGFGDCNGIASDGCEVDLQTNAANCGECKRACGADQTCKAGSCS